MLNLNIERFRPLIGVIISNSTKRRRKSRSNCFRPLIGVIISNYYKWSIIILPMFVSVPLSGLSFLINFKGAATEENRSRFRPLIGVIISNYTWFNSKLIAFQFPSPYRGYHF